MFLGRSVLMLVCFSSIWTASAEEKVKIMPLGDSITGSPGCWRALLWKKLQDNNIKNIDFVGTLPPQGCGFDYDGDNEGHGGLLATDLARESRLERWLGDTKPDIVMMHLGSNDVWSTKKPEEILGALDKLVDQMRASKESMKILIAQVTPLDPAGCTNCMRGIEDFNKVIPNWASSKSNEKSRITVVDCHKDFNVKGMTRDGVHPNGKGDEKLADSWFEPLVKAIKGG
ncbi:cellulose-binding protein [Colletotrichum abscissum]|uniref:Cellulose-binding protein n=2 Tax=Colletotrichum abscissum TaxID=1671311 RepID=A0A9P9X7F4_9PEZI|nr:cellulose-binding protein [Colletotrichum abscissum]